MKICLFGYGKMGRMVEQAAVRSGLEVAAVVDPVAGSRGDRRDADVWIDFSEPDSVIANIRAGLSDKVAIVVGTTGWYDRVEEIRRLVEDAGTGFVYGSNFSIGVNLMFRIVQHATELFSLFPGYDPYIEEAHHKFKKDAPSGTAVFLKRIMESARAGHGPVPVSSVRAGYIPGKHAVGFDSDADSLTITHESRSRAALAEGAILAARWIHGRKGFYEFSQVIDEQISGIEGGAES